MRTVQPAESTDYSRWEPKEPIACARVDYSDISLICFCWYICIFPSCVVTFGRPNQPSSKEKYYSCFGYTKRKTKTNRKYIFAVQIVFSNLILCEEHIQRLNGFLNGSIQFYRTLLCFGKKHILKKQIICDVNGSNKDFDHLNDNKQKKNKQHNRKRDD